MTNKLLRFVFIMMCVACLNPAYAAFKDIRIDLTGGNLLTESEISEMNLVTFGVAVGDDGSVTRVDASDPTAAITLTGKYHDGQHGWGNFSSTVKVDGPVKISMGSCQYGGDVKVTNEAGEQVATFNTSTLGNCFHGNKAENIVGANYKGEATTLTIAGGAYTPYIAVEAITGEIVEDVNVTFSPGSFDGCGTAPEAVKVEPGTEVVIPGNYTMYVEGKTLTGWSDGENTYAIGGKFAPAADVTLTPVFTDNSVSLADRTTEVAIVWDFQRKNGAPTVGYEGVTGFWVAQATVNGETIDVKMDFDTTKGKIANANWTDWAQMNSGTVFTVPACDGAKISLESYNATTNTTIDGQVINQGSKTPSFTCAGDIDNVELVIGDGSYFRYIKVVLPVAKKSEGGSYDGTPLSVVWDFNTVDTYGEVSSISVPEAVSIASFNLGECQVTGVEEGTNVDVTFVKIQPKNDANDMVEWFVKPVKGVTFTPTHVSGYIQRFGTDAENGVTVSVKLADGTLETLGNFTAPRNRKTQAEDKFGQNANYTQKFDITLTAEQQAKLASTDGFTLTATIGVGNAKQGGFSDIHIDGTLKGSTNYSFDNADASIEWAFESSSEDAPVVTPEGAYSLNSFSMGDNLTESAGKNSSVWGHFVGFMPKSKDSGASADNAVEWRVVPAKGVTFTPLKVSGKLCRFGTDGGKMDITVRTSEGAEKVLATGLIPPRDNKTQDADKHGAEEKYTPSFEYTLDDPTLATGTGFSLVINIYDLSGKEAGVSDIKIFGTVNGEVLPVPKYSFEAVAAPEDGGSVNVYPNGKSFDEGTELTLTATRNFGYKFVNWTDAEGKEVSTETKFKYTVAADSKLAANFEAINTYSLDYKIEGGANYYMVQAVPAPNVIGGKNMYEEGTEVTLTATSNPIVTFSNWSDGQTSSSINFVMNEDHSITATYSAIDFVAGWDFYRKGSSVRAADFYSADNDAAALILRNAEGKSEGWLDKSQESGGYEGRPGAVNWRTYGLGEYYWQTMVNASAFTDMKIITAMLYNYNAYTVQKVEYSLDGENWKTIGTITIEGNKNWTDAQFDIPADANNKATLYIRWISDKESAIDGTTSNNDGIALGATFITGTEKLIDDGTAPVLVSFVPEEGSENASINGRIVLTFDEKVKVTDNAKATINDMELEPQVTGKTVLFAYKNLAYGTKYTFTLAPNSISDLTDNAINKEIVINFTTKTRPAITKSLYDFVVPDDGSFLEALDAAAKREDSSKRFRIFIREKEGDYVIPASTDRFAEGTDGKQYPSATTVLNVPNVSIIGENMAGTSIINTVPEYKGGAHVLEGIGRGDVFQFTKQATGTYMQDITIKSAMPDNSGRNIVLNDQSDKTVCKNVCLWAYQDTYVSNNENSRYYFEGGLLRGRTDFLCGKGDVYYSGVELQMCAGGYLAVPSVAKKYGYIFKDCVITGPEEVDGQYTLGRPWGSGTPIALFIDTKMEVKPSAIGWAEMGSDGYPKQFAEYNSFTANGTPIDLSQRKNSFGPGKHANNPVLTKEEADAMTIATVMGGDDDWDPASIAEQAPLPANVALEGSVLSWDDSEYVLCWAVCEDGKVVGFTTEPEYTVSNPDAVYSVRAANEMGGLGEAVKVGGVTSIDGVYTGLEVVSTIYYNLEGMRVSESYNGVVIRVDTLANGEVVTSKILN